MMIHGATLTSLLWTSLFTLGALILFVILWSMYFTRYFSWELRNRRGLNYYGRPLQERRNFKNKIKMHAFFLKPTILLEAKLRRMKGVHDIASIQYKGVYGPSFSCSEESFHTATAYQPSAQDIFVVTQMRCGTTWMQQLVYQILTRGTGDFVDRGHLHLYAVSPWIEALDSVSIEHAPLIGATQKRIIKTHLPTRLCPYNTSARYVYVARNPVSCFASIIDYFRLTTGPFAPPISQVLDWYCSDRMWWLSWPEHVAGWWDWSQMKNNVLFIHFEEMKKDLTCIVRRVAAFLQVDMSEDEIRNILYKSSFPYMKEKEEYFEMAPPNLFSVSGSYFTSGQIDRDKTVSARDRQEILKFCRQRLSGRSYPFDTFYPEITEAAE